MDRLINNPLTLIIATSGFHRQLLPLLGLLVLTVLVLKGYSHIDNLIVIGIGAGGQYSL